MRVDADDTRLHRRLRPGASSTDTIATIILVAIVMTIIFKLASSSHHILNFHLAYALKCRLRARGYPYIGVLLYTAALQSFVIPRFSLHINIPYYASWIGMDNYRAKPFLTNIPSSRCCR